MFSSERLNSWSTDEKLVILPYFGTKIRVVGGCVRTPIGFECWNLRGRVLFIRRSPFEARHDVLFELRAWTFTRRLASRSNIHPFLSATVISRPSARNVCSEKFPILVLGIVLSALFHVFTSTVSFVDRFLNIGCFFDFPPICLNKMIFSNKLMLNWQPLWISLSINLFSGNVDKIISSLSLSQGSGNLSTKLKKRHLLSHNNNRCFVIDWWQLLSASVNQYHLMKTRD